MNRHIARSVLISALAVGFGTLALPASAHVTVSSDHAVKGGYATLTFKVPTEEENANTTKLEVDFPTDHPFAAVSTQQKSGWDIAVVKTALSSPLTNDDGQQVTERVATITWTAKTSDAAIHPEEFDTFGISVGPLPTDTDTLTFKALQTYSNGDVVRWIEESAPGGPEPEHPAPSITLVDKAAGAPVTSATPTSVAVQPSTTTTDTGSLGGVQVTADENVPTTNQVNTAVGLAIGGIALALIAAGLAGAALAKRSTAPAAPPPGPPPAF